MPPDVNVAVAKIEALDTTIFAIQPAHYSDRTSFLRVQKLVRRLVPRYRYLEVGSDIGGSILPHLLDPNCLTAISIDPRPKLQADERGVDFHYVGNSTARMIEELGKHVSAAEIGKLSTRETDASLIGPQELGMIPDLVLIDGEHTNVAAFSDFSAVLGMIKEDAVVTFHDANLVGDAIQIIERQLTYLKIPYSLVILPSCVAVFGFGKFLQPVITELSPYGEEKAAYFAAAREQRHSAIADAVVARTNGLRGASIADLVTWTANTELRLTHSATSRSDEMRQDSDQVKAANAEILRLRQALHSS